METKEKKQEEKTNRVMVMQKKDMPTQEVRTVLDEKEDTVELVTVEEALTEILENTRKIVKAL